MLRTAEIEAVRSRADRLYWAEQLSWAGVQIVRFHLARASDADFEGRPRRCSVWIERALFLCDQADR